VPKDCEVVSKGDEIIYEVEKKKDVPLVKCEDLTNKLALEEITKAPPSSDTLLQGMSICDLVPLCSIIPTVIRFEEKFVSSFLNIEGPMDFGLNCEGIRSEKGGFSSHLILGAWGLN